MQSLSFIRGIIFLLAFSSSPVMILGAQLTVLHSFNGNTDGLEPYAGLTMDAQGNLYGTTRGGAGGAYGTLFVMSSGTYQFTNLATFTSSGGAGYYPTGSVVVDSDGNIYGTTSEAKGSEGALYKYSASTHQLSLVSPFIGVNGAYPNGLVADSNGNLYGTTYSGSLPGQSNDGTVYSYSTSSSSFTSISYFSGSNGYQPVSSVILDSQGNIFGTTSQGGAFGYGTVFEEIAATHQIVTLYSFSGLDGSAPAAGLVMDKHGNLYGTTYNGGTFNEGTIFEIAAGTHQFSSLASFNGHNGLNPTASLIVDSAGNLFGTTSLGGDQFTNGYGSGTGRGTIFEYSSQTQQIITLYSGTGIGPTPFQFESNLIADSEGNLYGTSIAGGNGNQGTVFELTNTGFVVPEHNSLSLVVVGLMAFAVPSIKRVCWVKKTERIGATLSHDF